MLHHQEGSAEGGRRPDGRGDEAQLLRHRRRHRHRIGGLAHAVGHARPFEVRLAVAQRLGLTQRQPVRERRVRPRSARDGAPLPCELDTKADAQDALDAIAVSKQTVQYCVISSAAKNLGCFIDRDAAEQERRADGPTAAA